MSRTEVSLPTADGDARAFVFKPDAGQGPWPGAVLLMDAPAIRPALFEMGERLAAAGYVVVLPDLFWRAGPYPTLDIAAARAGDPAAVELFGKLRASTGAGRQMTDVAACLDFLARDPDVKPGKVGVTGYCMGGSIALRAAGTFPDRIGAAASFHGGNMATGDETSPHRLAPWRTAASTRPRRTCWTGPCGTPAWRPRCRSGRAAATAGCPPTCRCTIPRGPSGTGGN
jgi:carboxymethylenebutenolidase